MPVPVDPADLAARSDVCVVGAGVMGAWTAFWAQAGGAGPDEDWGGGRSVTLLDAWGAGHLRATSSDEHRIIRSAHGTDRFYARWARRALRHWERFADEWNVPLFHASGVLWFASAATGWEADSEATLRSLGIPVERLDPAAISARWPVIDPAGAAFGVLEPEAGFVMARRGVAATVAAFQRAGGAYALAAVRPGRSEGRRLLDVVDQAGRRWSAGTFVFAAGPWLPKLFPEAVGDLVTVTRQPVFYLGPGEGDSRWRWNVLPAWSDDAGGCYGIPSVDDRGFKIGIDRVGPRFDPSNGERMADPDDLRLARAFLQRRFPGLAGRPVLETRVPVRVHARSPFPDRSPPGLGQRLAGRRRFGPRVQARTLHRRVRRGPPGRAAPRRTGRRRRGPFPARSAGRATRSAPVIRHDG